MRLPNLSKSAALSDRIRFFSARATISVCSLMACSRPMRFTLPLTALLKESLRAPRFWMAIYMPPADRATTTAKVAASFALSVSLTLRSPFFGQRRASAALQCKNTFEVRNDDEGAVALADAAHEFGRPAHADARRVLDDGGVDVGDVVHLVGQNAGNGRLAVDIDLDDDDAGILVRRRALHIEGDTQVGKRHDAAAHIDEATDEGRRSGACGDRHEIEDLADAAGFDGEQLVLEPQGQGAHGAGVCSAHAALPVSAWDLSSWGWPVRTR